MKTLRKLTAVALLTCVLAVSASAGDMHTGYVPPPPPPPPTDPPPASATATDETDATGDLTADVLAALLNGLLAVLTSNRKGRPTLAAPLIFVQDVNFVQG